MIIQEPVQAAIWHCLNHYYYSDAVFLSERLYAEVKTDDSLFLLATAYYRSGQKDHAYHILKEKNQTSTQCRYLLGICAYELGKYAEAEQALLQKGDSQINTLEEITVEFGDQASFALSLLGKIAAKTERKTRAIEAWKKSLKLNPFQWSSFESLCKAGEKPNPQTVFQVVNVENLTPCVGTNISNVDSVIIMNSPDAETHEVAMTTPQQVLVNCNPNGNLGFLNLSKLCTPDGSPRDTQPTMLSGFGPLTKKVKSLRLRFDSESEESSLPSFGQLFEYTPEPHTGTPMFAQPKLTESNNHHQSLAKRMKAQVDQFINRKEPVLQNCKPLFSQSTNVTKTPTITLSVQPCPPCPNIRRSTRLFSNSNAVKENNKSPNRNKFATPKSPSRKTKQRISKCSVTKNTELNTKNKEKEKSETVTSAETKSAINSNNSVETCIQQAIVIQKQSAEGLMSLLRSLGEAFLNLSTFNCKAAIDCLNNLQANQYETSWVYCLLGLAYFELTDYEMSIKYFNKVHQMEPFRLQFMDVYSTALWHLQKEVALSALAQDLVKTNKDSAVTWCVNGNCFSLHKEHDTAIKFFQRAVQVDPGFPYAYTLLGHEFITTEELDKAMSCFRNAIRLDSRHYNAWFGIGTIYSKQERYHLAKINFSRALSINPQSSIILCHIGIVQHALKETEKALGTFNTAIVNNPKSPLCKFYRGSIYFALGRHSEALKELEELKQIVPKESLVYHLIGNIHKKLGNTDLALMHFNWATDLDPKGASSQIKEAFDPPSGRSGTAAESPASPAHDYPSESSSRLQLAAEVLNFANLPDDSEDSY